MYMPYHVTNSFFGVVHFYLQVRIDDVVRNLVALQVLKGVKICNRVDGHLYPQWQHDLGHYAPLIITDAIHIVDAVATVADSVNATIKHLVPPRHHPWNLTILSNFNDIESSLQLRH
jgi:hypothetical protein